MHCYDDRFRPYVRAELEGVVAEAERAVPKILANLPERLDRIVLAGGEVLLEPVRSRVLNPVLAALHGRDTRVIVQTTGDLLTGEVVRDLVDRGVWMVSVSGLDDFHVGHEGAAGTRLRERLVAMFAAAGIRPSGHAAPLQGWQDEAGPVFSMFGATPDTWIGKLWPRGRAWANGLSTATMADDFCGAWSGGRGFLNPHEGAEVSVEPDGSVYPCCVKTGVPLGNLTEERLDDILTSLRGVEPLEAIGRGDPAGMAASLGVNDFADRCQSNGHANACLGCADVHRTVLAPLIADIRHRRLAA